MPDKSDYWQKFWKVQSSSLHRHTLEEIYQKYGHEFQIILGNIESKKVLEIGCGDGCLYRHLGFEKTYYRGVDFSPSLLAQFKKQYPQLDLVEQDGVSYNDGEKYDIIFTNEFIQFLDCQKLEKFLTNAHKMMSPHSRLILGNVPWKILRLRYYSGELQRSMQKNIRTLCKNVWSIIKYGDTQIGFWYNPSHFIQWGMKQGLEVSIYSSIFYLYRFHVEMKKV